MVSKLQDFKYSTVLAICYHNSTVVIATYTRKYNANILRSRAAQLCHSLPVSCFLMNDLQKVKCKDNLYFLSLLSLYVLMYFLLRNIF